MKTVVFGLFDDLEDARRMLLHLAGTSLDMESVTVIHRDIETQRRLSSEAGLPPRRGLTAALIAGALGGGTLGLIAGGGPLASLGPLLGAAAGVLVGAFAGAAAAALGESLHLPPEHAKALAAAVDEGSTVVLIRTASAATARVIRDLFVQGGSRQLAASGGADQPAGDLARGAAGRSLSGGAQTSWGAVAHDERAQADPAHDLFAPPWRRTPSSVRVPPGAAAAIEATDEAEVDLLAGRRVPSDPQAGSGEA